MKWMRNKVWLFGYAVEFKRKTGWSFIRSWVYGGITGDSHDWDLESMGCPVDMVEEDLYCWTD